ncbi:MAG: lipoyl(octanoyl) transferase LipB [Alphaproteobacteria bacterium]|nr:lipoyl(octanoyl) transferase LipB [Alphaproteobacteria bacterium]MCB9792808.1 lipoyl(octanoyl) transferase LipB [Alphaproteobacteria bacterium]
MHVRDLGRMPYADTWALQKEVLEARIAGEGPDTLLVVEHPPVYTLGRRRGAMENVLAAGDVPVVQVERGGDVTWHGPGQLVIYPILALPEGRRDVHRHLRDLEEAGIRTLDEYGIVGERDPRNAGVWVKGRKIMSVGVAIRQWTTWHGLALNVAPDMSYFDRINACGLGPGVMTSMAWEMAEAPPLEDVKARLIAALEAVFSGT